MVTFLTMLNRCVHAPVQLDKEELAFEFDRRGNQLPAGRKGTFDGRKLSKVLLRYFCQK